MPYDLYEGMPQTEKSRAEAVERDKKLDLLASDAIKQIQEARYKSLRTAVTAAKLPLSKAEMLSYREKFMQRARLMPEHATASEISFSSEIKRNQGNAAWDKRSFKAGGEQYRLTEELERLEAGTIPTFSTQDAEKKKEEELQRRKERSFINSAWETYRKELDGIEMLTGVANGLGLKETSLVSNRKDDERESTSAMEIACKTLESEMHSQQAEFESERDEELLALVAREKEAIAAQYEALDALERLPDSPEVSAAKAEVSRLDKEKASMDKERQFKARKSIFSSGWSAALKRSGIPRDSLPVFPFHDSDIMVWRGTGENQEAVPISEAWDRIALRLKESSNSPVDVTGLMEELFRDSIVLGFRDKDSKQPERFVWDASKDKISLEPFQLQATVTHEKPVMPVAPKMPVMPVAPKMPVNPAALEMPVAPVAPVMPVMPERRYPDAPKPMGFFSKMWDGICKAVGSRSKVGEQYDADLAAHEVGKKMYTDQVAQYRLDSAAFPDDQKKFGVDMLQYGKKQRQYEEDMGADKFRFAAHTSAMDSYNDKQKQYEKDMVVYEQVTKDYERNMDTYAQKTKEYESKMADMPKGVAVGEAGTAMGAYYQRDLKEINRSTIGNGHEERRKHTIELEKQNREKLSTAYDAVVKLRNAQLKIVNKLSEDTQKAIKAIKEDYKNEHYHICAKCSSNKTIAQSKFDNQVKTMKMQHEITLKKRQDTEKKQIATIDAEHDELWRKIEIAKVHVEEKFDGAFNNLSELRYNRLDAMGKDTYTREKFGVKLNEEPKQNQNLNNAPPAVRPLANKNAGRQMNS